MESQSFVNSTSGSSEWKGYISSVYAELHSEIVKTGMRHFEAEDTITTTASTYQYAVPDNYLSTIGVDYVWDSNSDYRRQLHRAMAQERNMYRNTSGSSNAVAWAMVGGGATPLELYPTPPASQTYKHLYIPHAADLSTAADSTLVDVVTPLGEEFLYWGVAVMAKGKEESDVTLALKERERCRLEVIEWATLRAFRDPPRHIVREEIEERDEFGYGRGGFGW